jgi:GT2 family glycosyltransferase
MPGTPSSTPPGGELGLHLRCSTADTLPPARMSTGCDVSLVLVAFRSSALLPAAVASFRREAAAAGLAGEAIVVEQSEDDAEVERAAAAGPDLLLTRPNRGYAGGVNAGIAAARGRWLLVGNPDVELGPGALTALLAALDDGWGVVGPQFALAGALFPPADDQTPRAEVARRRAWRSRRAWEGHLRTELTRWSRVWDASAPVSVPTLSGALLAFTAELSTRLGPWPEDYFLYFEETEWLRRARRRGARLAVVPAARAVHAWGHAAHPGAFAGRFASSQRLFFHRFHPLLGRPALAVRTAEPPDASRWSGPSSRVLRWLLSPSPRGFPAALVADGLAVDAVAREFCLASGRDDVTLVGFAADAPILGPFRWSLSAAGTVSREAQPSVEAR